MHWYLVMKNWLADLTQREEGQDLTEYVLLVGLIAIVLAAAAIVFAGVLQGRFSAWGTCIGGWGS
jgi:Flp pilus assembly pilin Flp